MHSVVHATAVVIKMKQAAIRDTAIDPSGHEFPSTETCGAQFLVNIWIPLNFSFPWRGRLTLIWMGEFLSDNSFVKETVMVQELTVDAFDDQVVASEIPVLVDFWSPGCGPCRLQDPILTELASEGVGRFEVKKVNVWDEPDLATRFDVSAVPTLLIFDKGKVVKSLVGYQVKSKLLGALQAIV